MATTRAALLTPVSNHVATLERGRQELIDGIVTKIDQAAEKALQRGAPRVWVALIPDNTTYDARTEQSVVAVSVFNIRDTFNLPKGDHELMHDLRTKLRTCGWVASSVQHHTNHITFIVTSANLVSPAAGCAACVIC